MATVTFETFRYQLSTGVYMHPDSPNDAGRRTSCNCLFHLWSVKDEIRWKGRRLRIRKAICTYVSCSFIQSTSRLTEPRYGLQIESIDSIYERRKFTIQNGLLCGFKILSPHTVKLEPCVFQVINLLPTTKNWFKISLFLSQLVNLSLHCQVVIFTRNVYLRNLFHCYQ